jgi:hypothetical protein
MAEILNFSKNSLTFRGNQNNKKCALAYIPFSVKFARSESTFVAAVVVVVLFAGLIGHTQEHTGQKSVVGGDAVTSVVAVGHMVEMSLIAIVSADLHTLSASFHPHPSSSAAPRSKHWAHVAWTSQRTRGTDTTWLSVTATARRSRASRTTDLTGVPGRNTCIESKTRYSSGFFDSLTTLKTFPPEVPARRMRDSPSFWLLAVTEVRRSLGVANSQNCSALHTNLLDIDI